MASIQLRPVAASDLDVFFEHQLDPEALRLGLLTSRERPEFDAHWTRILADAVTILRTVESDDIVAGYVTSFLRDGLREVAYWFGREHWGKGIATEALRALLAQVTERPLHARVVVDHIASRRVLEKVGFSVQARETTVGSSGDAIEEFLLRLD